MSNNERITALENRVEELENTPRGFDLRWDAILILGIWSIAALFVSFSPVGAENFKEIFGGAGLATLIILFWF